MSPRAVHLVGLVGLDAGCRVVPRRRAVACSRPMARVADPFWSIEHPDFDGRRRKVVLLRMQSAMPSEPSHIAHLGPRGVPTKPSKSSHIWWGCARRVLLRGNRCGAPHSAVVLAPMPPPPASRCPKQSRARRWRIVLHLMGMSAAFGFVALSSGQSGYAAHCTSRRKSVAVGHSMSSCLPTHGAHRCRSTMSRTS